MKNVFNFAKGLGLTIYYILYGIVYFLYVILCLIICLLWNFAAGSIYLFVKFIYQTTELGSGEYVSPLDNYNKFRENEETQYEYLRKWKDFLYPSLIQKWNKAYDEFFFK